LDNDGSSTGSAYAFVRSGVTWTTQGKFIPNDGSLNDKFGFSVAVSKDMAVIGAPDSDENGEDSGSAYVFIRTGVAWTEQQKLLPQDGTEYDHFGSAVAVSEDTAVIGGDGSGYVFVRTGGTWTEQQKLVPSSDGFGVRVAISGDTAVIGGGGSGYIFVRTGDTWTEQQKLLPNDGAEDDHFGSAVAILGGTAFIGARNDDDNGEDSGSAYVFVLGRSPGDTCTIGTECASGFCLGGVCSLAPGPSCADVPEGTPCEEEVWLYGRGCALRPEPPDHTGWLLLGLLLAAWRRRSATRRAAGGWPAQ
jgi:hypothetical protein